MNVVIIVKVIFEKLEITMPFLITTKKELTIRLAKN